MRSKSRGFVKLKSNNPFEAPLIKFNYMSHEDDFPNFRKSLRLSREILNQDALAPFKGSEIQPGDNVVSDEGLDEFIKNNCESAYHPCGTCKIGEEDDPSSDNDVTKTHRELKTYNKGCVYLNKQLMGILIKRE